MEYYSALKSSEILTPATTRMDHEDVMLSELSPIQKSRHCDSASVGSLEESGSQRQKIGNFRGCPGLGEEGGRLVFNGYRVSVW